MVEVATADGIATLTLARPERANALSDALVEALQGALDTALSDEAVHTVAFAGAGANFCSGFDLSDLASETDATLLARFRRVELLLQTVWHAPVRTAAHAMGKAWGAGADLFASCDLRLAHPGSSFRFPGSAFGIVLGTRRLVELLGWDRSRALVTEGAVLDAPGALSTGLATQIVEGDARSLLAARPPAVDRQTLAAIRAASRLDHRAGDLDALERSASRSGLKARIAAYGDRLRAARTALPSA